MCDDLTATRAELEAKGVEMTRPVCDVRWGLLTAIRLRHGASGALRAPSPHGDRARLRVTVRIAPTMRLPRASATGQGPRLT